MKQIDLSFEVDIYFKYTDSKLWKQINERVIENHLIFTNSENAMTRVTTLVG